MIDDLIADLVQARGRYGNLPVRALWEGHTTPIGDVFRSDAALTKRPEFANFAGEAILIEVDSMGAVDREDFEHPQDSGIERAAPVIETPTDERSTSADAQDGFFRSPSA